MNSETEVKTLYSCAEHVLAMKVSWLQIYQSLFMLSSIGRHFQPSFNISHSERFGHGHDHGHCYAHGHGDGHNLGYCYGLVTGCIYILILFVTCDHCWSWSWSWMWTGLCFWPWVWSWLWSQYTRTFNFS